MQKTNNILDIQNLTVSFENEDGAIYAVDNLSYSLREGEVLGIVGESGSGKSVNVLGFTGLLNSSNMKMTGKAFYKSKNILELSNVEKTKLLGPEIGFVFQNPMSSLNPVMKIGPQIVESAIYHGIITKKEAKNYALELLTKVGIQDPEIRYNFYPHQFSGGMRQRVMIAIAMACKPKLLICDEPTTALDVTVEKQILDLLKDMQKEYNLSIILITHNLSIALSFSDKLMVMFAGNLLEYGSSFDLLGNPQHPYTKGLFESSLEIGKKGQAISGVREKGSLLSNMPEGSIFRTHEEIKSYQGKSNLKRVSNESDHIFNVLYTEADK